MKKKSIRFGLNTIRSLTLDEWINLWLETNIGDGSYLIEDEREITDCIKDQLKSFKTKLNLNKYMYKE